jgi:hypothetical protein
LRGGGLADGTKCGHYDQQSHITTPFGHAAGHPGSGQPIAPSLMIKMHLILWHVYGSPSGMSNGLKKGPGERVVRVLSYDQKTSRQHRAEQASY